MIALVLIGLLFVGCASSSPQIPVAVALVPPAPAPPDLSGCPTSSTSTEAAAWQRAYQIEVEATKRWIGIAKKRAERRRALERENELLGDRIAKLELEQVTTATAGIPAAPTLTCEPALSSWGVAAAICGACAGGSLLLERALDRGAP